MKLHTNLKKKLLLIGCCSILLACISTPQNTKERVQLINEITLTQSASGASYKSLKATEKKILTYQLPDSLLAHNYYLLGLHFVANKQKDSAAFYLYKATKNASKNSFSEFSVKHFYTAWDFFVDQELYGDCITIADNFFSLLQHNDYENLSLAYFFKENNSLNTKAYTDALVFNEKRIETLLKLQDSSQLAPALMSKARLLFTTNRLDDAITTLNDIVTSESITKSTDINRRLYNDLGVYFYYKQDYNSALTHYKKGLYHAKRSALELQKNNFIATGYLNIAEAYLELQVYDLASKYLDSTLVIGLENIENRLQKSFLSYQIRLAIVTNDDGKRVNHYIKKIFDYQASEYQKKFDRDLYALKESINKEKVLIKNNQQADFENLRLINKQHYIVLTSSLIILVLIIFYLKRKFTLEHNNLLLHQRLLRSQMNPHFTFNTLQAIRSLIEKDAKGAKKYLITFSRLLRTVLENSTHNFVKLENEIITLKKYLDLQLLRFPEKFTYTIEYINLEEEDMIFIPPMLIQPFLENSIEHGFQSIDYMGEIRIKLALEGKFINCNIEDNGSGMTATKSHRKDAHSVALIANFIKKTTKKKILIINKTDYDLGNGVIIDFLIPFKKK